MKEIRKAIKSSFYALLFFIVLVVPYPADGKDVSLEEQYDELLELPLEELLNIKITTATKTEIKKKEAPAAVYIITARQIRERGYQNLVDVFHDLPGFDFQHIYGVYPEKVHQRGFLGGNISTLLYINGILENNISSVYIDPGSLRYPLNNVDRIEIISGPASALYGTNAFTGVINIITKDGKNDPGHEISATFGAWMDIDYTGRLSGPLR